VKATKVDMGGMGMWMVDFNACEEERLKFGQGMNHAWETVTTSSRYGLQLMAMGELVIRKYKLLKFGVNVPKADDSELCESW
jgi:hypothetical protein